MSRQDANAAFARTSFLYGGNAAYIEDLYARYEADPASVDAEWRAFFDEPEGRAAPTSPRTRSGAVLEAAELAAVANGELVSALDGNWAEVEKRIGDKIKAKAQAAGVELSAADVQQATRDSIHALMLIRAYRMRGHLHANLDPLGLEPQHERRGARSALLRLHRGRPRPQDLPRQRARPRIRHHPRDPRDPAAHLLPDARRRVHAHLRSRAEGAGSRSASKGRDKEITFTREGKRAILNKLIEAEGFEKFCDVKFTGTKRFGLDGGESMIPALEQIIKRGGALGVQGDRVGMAHRGRLNVLAQVMGKPHRAHLPRVQGRLVRARRRRRLGRREVSPRRLVGPRVRRQQGAPVADRQPVASRDRRSGGARQGARQAGPARRDAAKTAPW